MAIPLPSATQYALYETSSRDVDMSLERRMDPKEYLRDRALFWGTHFRAIRYVVVPTGITISTISCLH